MSGLDVEAVLTSDRDDALRVWTLRDLYPVAPLPAPRTVILLPGGSYVARIRRVHWRLAAWLARSGATVRVVLYPLAPRATAAAVVPAVADYIAAQVRAHGAGTVAVVGDSAGGGLALAAVQRLAAEDRPARLVLVSPWLDVAVDDPRSLVTRDAMLGVERLRAAGRLWAGELPVDDPLVSPLAGDLDGLPATTVYSGTADLLHPDAIRLAERAEVQLVLREGLMHGWPIAAGIPEARRERAALLRAVLGEDSGEDDGQNSSEDSSEDRDDG
ncbi:MAG: alpha/beta hydrolase fold domain-containing protein [Microbacteriaceae bacterium]